MILTASEYGLLDPDMPARSSVVPPRPALAWARPAGPALAGGVERSRPPRAAMAALALAIAGVAPPLTGTAAEHDTQRDLRWWLVGGQLTSVGMVVPGFQSPYRNPAMSFGGRNATAGWSLVATVYGGARLWDGAFAVVEPEFADGAGAPNVSGLAGYVDANIIRVAKVGTKPYVARAFLEQDIALGPPAPEPERGEEGAPEDRFAPTGAVALRRPRPESRVEITVGKLSMTDFFDVATATSDPRHHFLNWSLMTNGAWDYAADTRGYDWAVVVGLEQARWALRAAAAMMPTVANGPVLDGDLAHAHSEMVEAEIRYALDGSPGAVKLLGYANHARMGSFSDALAATPLGQAPAIGAVVRRGASKVGLGLLVDQRIGPAAAFLRASWNDGRTEEFVFTQIERAVSAGAEIPTDGWGRAGDRIGIGIAVNGLTPSHVRYLQAGGVDFQLGDGALRYGPEVVAEAYYVLHLGRVVELTADVQAIADPGMNADRGPAAVFGLRFHAHL